MLDNAEKTPAPTADTEKEGRAKKKRDIKRVLTYSGMGVLLVLVLTLLIISVVCMIDPHAYMPLGKNKLIPVGSSAMSPDIRNGDMIVVRPVDGAADIHVGDIIAFETDVDGNLAVVTRKVAEIGKASDGTAQYTVVDAAGNVFEISPKYSDVIGVWTGDRCGFFGGLFGFFNTPQGFITLFILLCAVVFICYFLLHRESARRRTLLAINALKRSEQALSGVNLRYDNIREITAVMDVLGMLTTKPVSRADRTNVAARLTDFIEAETIELPQTPETAAVLDSLPAPDTPMTLAAALRSGATLRQAEDGQTLILTGISGGKSILLTPIQTSDGVILCQQGVRIRSDIAPNIESVGQMSMPGYPEFFEGQPLEKNVEYPELPQPRRLFDAAMLAGGETEGQGNLQEGAPALSAPVPVGPARFVSPDSANLIEGGHELRRLESGESSRIKTHREGSVSVPAIAEKINDIEARERDGVAAYAQYRESSAELELRQVEELNALLQRVVPLTADEQARLDEYRAAQKKPTAKPAAKTTTKPATKSATQKKPRSTSSAKKQSGDKDTAAFVSALSPADRELYLSEQKLSKARADAIKRLKKIEKDRKLLEKITKTDTDK